MSSESTKPVTGPTRASERIVAIDILRGFALLGILIMNIQGFAMPTAAYLNPTVYGDLNGANRWVWILSHVFADQKFMTIFSLLFGAGIVLMSEKLDARGQRAWGLHYRRTFWLLLIGLAHAFLLSTGDILVAYAVCGLWVYLLRRLRPGWQLALGLLSVSVPALLLLGTGLTMQFIPPETLQELRADWKPPATTIETEVAAYRGNWLDQMEARVPASMEFQTFVLLLWTNWRAGGLMLIGMALYRWGVPTGRRARGFYARYDCPWVCHRPAGSGLGRYPEFCPQLDDGVFQVWTRRAGELLGQSVRQRRLHWAADAVGPLGRVGLAAEGVGRGGTDRAEQLSVANDPGDGYLLRARSGAVRLSREGGADRHCRCDLGGPAGGVAAVAALLPLRAL